MVEKKSKAPSKLKRPANASAPASPNAPAPAVAAAAVQPTVAKAPRAVAPAVAPSVVDAPAAKSAAPGVVDAPVGDGRMRAVIDAVMPVVDGGRFAAKGIAGEAVRVEAHCFTDGHDRLRAVVRWEALADPHPFEVEMKALPNDVWRATFIPPVAGRYRFTVIAWVDHFESWRSELERRTERADIGVALLVGAGYVEATAARASQEDAAALQAWAKQLRAADRADGAAMKTLALDPARSEIVERYPDRSLAAAVTRELIVDRQRAGFSSWYELFPRSAAAQPGRHGTFRDVEARLPYVAEMGFDVLYFPPIHPIGKQNRKGKNNALTAQPGDVGSPWAIGSAEGGHKDILAELGTLEDFRRLIAAAARHDIEIALDMAFQCAPDHPYVREHPEWFKHRPDGSVQYAENPPKKYQDIYPFDFESSDWRGLWAELKSVMDFWVAQGVRIFRVDNPHTKAFPFWEWAIGDIKRAQPDVLFLAEAFTRPKVMHRLAKLGFSQSYTYFTWRTGKYELTEYFEELSSGPGADYFRPNVWPNTPDILHEVLHTGSRAVFAARVILAATLSSNYGIYGPVYELLEGTSREPGSEEYRDSEKYQLRHWDLQREDSLAPLIARLNRIRRDNVALHSDRSLTFCGIDNPQLIAYVKHEPEAHNLVLTVVNLDPYNVQSGWLDFDPAAFDPSLRGAFQVHDLLSDQRFQWNGGRHYVALDPYRLPAHVFRVRRHLRSEHDFDYFL